MGEVDKSILRREFLHKRKLLAPEEVSRRSQLIHERVWDYLQLEGRMTIFHCFLPIDRNREVNTWPLVKRLAQTGNDVLISKTDFQSKIMTHYHYAENMSFDMDKLGIPTPSSGKRADVLTCQCVFLPLVVADREGGRIGYGGGYYDRLLESFGEVIKIGLSLGPCLDKITFLEPHDVKLDYCITPTEIIDCTHA